MTNLQQSSVQPSSEGWAPITYRESNTYGHPSNLAYLPRGGAINLRTISLYLQDVLRTLLEVRQVGQRAENKAFREFIGRTHVGQRLDELGGGWA